MSEKRPTLEELYSKKATVRKDDFHKYFSESGFAGIADTAHNPILVTEVNAEGAVSIRTLHDLSELSKLPDDTKCVGQWRGENRSDYFEFTAGEYRIFRFEQDKAEKEKARKEKEEREEKRREEERNEVVVINGKEQVINLNRLGEMMTAALRILHDDPTIRAKIVKRTEGDK